MKRDQFTFYRSYYEALKTLPAKELKAAILAICAYALDEEPPQLSGIVNSVFVLIRPTLDSGRKKAENRGNKPEQAKNKPEQTGTNEEQPKHTRRTNKEHAKNKSEQTDKEKEGEKEGEREGEVEREDDMSISFPTTTTATARAREAPKRQESAAVAYLLRKINPNASGECLRELLDYERQLGAEVCLYALQYAVDEQKTAWSYIRAILSAYVRDGVKTLDDVKRRDQQRTARPSGIPQRSSGNPFLQEDI